MFADGIGVYVPVDAVHEFRVTTSNFEAQYGRASGGVVNVSTKAGSNAFHGGLWEFNRLAAYTANTETNDQINSAFLAQGGSRCASGAKRTVHAQSIRLRGWRPDSERQALLFRQHRMDTRPQRRYSHCCRTNS